MQTMPECNGRENQKTPNAREEKGKNGAEVIYAIGEGGIEC